MKRKQAKSFKAARADDRTFTATIATTGVVDSDGDVVAPGALDGQVVPIQPSHDATHHSLGKARVREEGDRVVVVGEFNDTAAARDWASAIKFDLDNPPAVQEWSWGFVPVEWRMDEVDGEQVRVLERVDLLEVSPVIRGASVGTATTCAGDGCKGSKSCGCGGKCDGRGPQPSTEEVFQAWLADQRRKGGLVGWRRRPARVALALKVAAAARALGIDCPPVYTIERCDLVDADVRTKTDVSGFLEHDRHRSHGMAIHVRDDLDHAAELVTTGHEVAHAFEVTHALPVDERACEAYGKAFARAVTYGLPMPTAVGEPAA